MGDAALASILHVAGHPSHHIAVIPLLLSYCHPQNAVVVVINIIIIGSSGGIVIIATIIVIALLSPKLPLLP
jgi:hypothetical protein